MTITRFHVPTEIRKALAGKKTKVRLESLVLAIGKDYLDMLEQTDEQKGVDELERMFRLEDSR